MDLVIFFDIAFGPEQRSLRLAARRFMTDSDPTSSRCSHFSTGRAAIPIPTCTGG